MEKVPPLSSCPIVTLWFGDSLPQIRVEEILGWPYYLWACVNEWHMEKGLRTLSPMGEEALWLPGQEFCLYSASDLSNCKLLGFLVSLFSSFQGE